MKITIIRCDRCQAVIEPADDRGMIRGLGCLKEQIEETDLCQPCAAKLLEWLRAAPGREPEPSPPIRDVEPSHPGDDA